MTAEEHDAFWAQVFRFQKCGTRRPYPPIGFYRLVSGDLSPGMTAVIECVTDAMLASGKFIWRRKAGAGQVLVRVKEYTPPAKYLSGKLVAEKIETRPVPRKRRKRRELPDLRTHDGNSGE